MSAQSGGCCFCSRHINEHTGETTHPVAVVSSHGRGTLVVRFCADCLRSLVQQAGVLQSETAGIAGHVERVLHYMRSVPAATMAYGLPECVIYRGAGVPEEAWRAVWSHMLRRRLVTVRYKVAP
jgi:hypothetical protein